eukprot:scaffold3884_cov76-Cyclotella_meneghiniana.AAC.4
MALRIIHRQWQRHLLPSLHITARRQAAPRLPFSSIPFDGVSTIIAEGGKLTSRQAKHSSTESAGIDLLVSVL